MSGRSYASVVLLAAGLIATISAVSWAAEKAVERSLRSEVAADLAAFSAQASNDSLISAIELMDSRANSDNVDSDLRYVLLEPESALPLAGNLDNWPADFALPDAGNTGEITRHGVLVGTSAMLDGHFPVFVGRSIESFVKARQLFLLISGAVLALAFVGKLLAERRRARRTQRRLVEINQCLSAYLNGDRNKRLVVNADDPVGTMSREINTLLDLLSSRMQNYETIAEQIVHELRSPIARTVAEMGNAAGSDMAVARELLQTIDSVTALADISHREIVKRPVALEEIIVSMANLYADAAEDAGLMIHVECQSARVTGDRGLLDRMVANLLENALRYSEPGGDIVLRCGMDGDAAFLSISDSGPGLSGLPSEPGILLNRGAVGKKTGGWGIGLAFCLRIAERHDATITFIDREAKAGLSVIVSF